MRKLKTRMRRLKKELHKYRRQLHHLRKLLPKRKTLVRTVLLRPPPRVQPTVVLPRPLKKVRKLHPPQRKPPLQTRVRQLKPLHVLRQKFLPKVVRRRRKPLPQVPVFDADVQPTLRTHLLPRLQVPKPRNNVQLPLGQQRTKLLPRPKPVKQIVLKVPKPPP